MLLLLGQRATKAASVASEAQKPKKFADKYIEKREQQLFAMHQQLYGGPEPWAFELAYRVPDTAINVQCVHQAGRTRISLSSVASKTVQLAEPYAIEFVHGFGPGNLGLSVNLNI